MSDVRSDIAASPAGEDAWRALVAKTLGDKPPESLRRATVEGLPIDPLYAPAERPAAFPPRPFDAEAAKGRITRLSVDLARGSRPGYEMEVLYPHTGVLSRQDDRYHTVPYSVGFLRCLDEAQPLDPRLAGAPMRPLNTWTRFDHPTKRVQSYFGGADVGLEECCFVPRSARAPEGDGYLLGVAQRQLENRSELLVLDAQRLAEGPLARVLMPFRIFGQIHGWWVPQAQRQAA